MGMIKLDDIVGFWFKDEVVCFNCTTVEEKQDFSEDEVIARDAIENTDDCYFCDRCKARL